MQPVSTEFLAALKGSHTPTVRVDAWYDGTLLETGLPIADGATLTLDSTRAIAGQITGLTVVDPDGLLEPRTETDALAPYGSRLHASASIDGFAEQVSLGWYRITRSHAHQQWHPYELKDGSRQWITRGGQVEVDADDLMWQVVEERFMAPQSPLSLSSVIGEIGRLIQDIVPLGDTTGVTDAPVPASVTYSDNRADAIADLAAALGAVPRMSPAGTLDLVPDSPGASVWSIAVGEDGTFVDADTVLTASDLPNAAASTGTTPGGLPIVGTALEAGGALRFGGPHGRIPTFHPSPLITTQAAANADASTVLRAALAARSQILDVTCLANPALQLYDTVTLVTPLGSLDGQVRAITYPMSPGPMRLRVSADRASYLALWSQVIQP